MPLYHIKPTVDVKRLSLMLPVLEALGLNFGLVTAYCDSLRDFT